MVSSKSASLKFGKERVATGPEFLVVCAELSAFKVLSAAIRGVKGRLNCAPTASCAHDYIVRRRVDGIVIDMNVPGAAELIRYIRTLDPYRTSIIFACMSAMPESARACVTGANFVIHPPLLSAKIVHTFGIAASIMGADKRRYYRCPLMVPITLQVGGRKLQSITKNVSEGGMTLWSLPYYLAGSKLEFILDSPFTGLFQGTGEIAWNKDRALAGVKFNILSDATYTRLSALINRGVLKETA